MINWRVAVFTAIEDIALVSWLALVRAGNRVLGVLTLPVGFFLEHVVAYNVKRGTSLFSFNVPKGKILLNAVLETGVWVTWLTLWPIYSFSVLGTGVPLVASLFLYPALVVEHSLTDNIFHNRPLTSNLVNNKVLRFSFVEWLGATLWLGLVGAGLPLLGIVALVAAQQVEHEMAIKIGQQK